MTNQRSERVKDIIDYRSERAKEIVKVFKKLRFRFALVSDHVYMLGGYKMIRLVNIIVTSKRMRRSLNNFERHIKKGERISELPEWDKR